MNEMMRKVVAVEALPEALREGFDAARPVEITQEPRKRGYERLRERTAKMTFPRLKDSQEAVDRVRAIRDGGPF